MGHIYICFRFSDHFGNSRAPACSSRAASQVPRQSRCRGPRIAGARRLHDPSWGGWNDLPVAKLQDFDPQIDSKLKTIQTYTCKLYCIISINYCNPYPNILTIFLILPVSHGNIRNFSTSPCIIRIGTLDLRFMWCSWPKWTFKCLDLINMINNDDRCI